MTDTYVTEAFTPEERTLLEPHFSNLEGPVFALTNLPEAVKGAMFARYSRTTKSLRRLFLDEFADDVAGVDIGSVTAASKRAAGIYERVFVEYGDDSVAQLGGVHLACEQSSQLLAKALEWGRLAAYLEQSTRYMRYDDKPGGRWRATVPPELAGTDLAQTYEMFLDDVFTAYGRMYEQLNPWFRTRFPKQPDDTDFVYNQTILAKTCDTLRMVLPAGTRSNLGIYATGQSYEQLLLRLAQHPLAEMRAYGDLMLVELRKVIPEFLKRVDQPDRGVAWSAYWRDVRERTQELTAKLVGDVEPEPRGLVNLVDHDPEGELKVTAAVLYAHSDLPDDQLLEHRRDALTGRTRGDPRGERRRAREPAAQARARVGAHPVPVRRALRLRGVPGPAASPPAHPRVAASHPDLRLRRAGRDRCGGLARGLGVRDAAFARDARRDRRGGPARCRAVRRVDGLPDPLRDADDRP